MARPLTLALVVSLLLMTILPGLSVAQVATPDVPGGNLIVFASTHDASDTLEFDLYTIVVDGSGLTRLTTFSEEGMAAMSPIWSPDGSRIAFGARNVMRAGLNIYLMDGDGGNPVQVTDVGDCNDYDFFEFHGPDWSPDGSRFAFAADFERACGRGVRPDIHLADASGEEVTPLTTLSEEGHSSWLPEWSPDGENIAFVSGPSSEMGQCYIVSVRDGEPRRLDGDEAGCLFPIWSPDGTTLAVTGSMGFLLISMVGDDRVSINVEPDLGLIWNPTWSPDGTKILFETFPRMNGMPDRATFHVLDIASGEVTTIETGTYFPVGPAWSPDGSQIAFVGALDGQEGSDLYVVGPDGIDPSRVTTVGDGGANVASPAWAPAR